MDLKSLTAIKNSIKSELVHAQNHETSSFPYIRHTLPKAPLVKKGEIFQVIVIGGTVIKIALCKYNAGKLQILTKKSSRPPKFITKNDLISYISHEVDLSVNVVALNFAYPLNPVFKDGLLDGELLSGSKENTFIGLTGQKIGEEIAGDLKKNTGKHLRITAANDTICLLLAGLMQHPKETLLGGIVGTGVNFALFDGDEAINLEAANFDKFVQTSEGREIDGNSTEPGKSLFEKEVSGAYLYQHYNLKYKKHELFEKINSTEELEMLARGKNINAQHARQIFDHSAALIACQIAGILEYKKKNCIGMMEGSLFWKAQNYKTLVETYISLLTSYTIRFENPDDDSIIGAAMLVG